MYAISKALFPEIRSATPPPPSAPLSEICVSFQLVANSVVAAAVNVAGVWLHQMMEAAQRKAFLDTRNCIAARLHMEDENDKLVSTGGGPGPWLRRCSMPFSWAL